MVGRNKISDKLAKDKEAAVNQIESWKSLSKLWIRWTAVTTISGALAYPAVVLIAVLGDGWPSGFWLGIPAGGAVAGLMAGFFQERVLRTHLPVTKQWIVMTVLGWAIGLTTVVGISSWFLAYAKEMPPWYALTVYLIGAGIAGALSGVGQWMLLRKRIDKSVWWFMACAVGSLSAWLIVLAIWYLFGQGALPSTVGELPAALFLGGMAGWMMGMEQGVALVGLIAQEEWERGQSRMSIKF
jgi:hypothetical protein